MSLTLYTISSICLTFSIPYLLVFSLSASLTPRIVVLYLSYAFIICFKQGTSASIILSSSSKIAKGLSPTKLFTQWTEYPSPFVSFVWCSGYSPCQIYFEPFWSSYNSTDLSKLSSMHFLLRSVTISISSIPNAITSSIIYSNVSLSTIESISFAWAFVTGRNLVLSPAAGMITFLTVYFSFSL